MPQSLPSYEEVLQQGRDQNNQRRLQQAAQTAPLDYDRTARIFYVQGKTQLPSEVIDADLDNLYESVKRKDFNYLNYTNQMNGSPIFNEWAASDMYHPAVIERDRRNLTLFERSADSLWRGGQRGDAMIELSRIANRRRAGDMREGDEEILEDLRQLVGNEFGIDGVWQNIMVMTGEQGSIQGEIISQSWQLAAAGAVQGAVLSSWGGVTALAGAAIGAGAGWRVGAYGVSQQLEQGLAYDEYMQMGANAGEAYRISGMVGAANGALEMIGLSFIAKNIPGVKQVSGNLGKSLVEKMLTKPTFRQAAGRVLWRYGESMGGEILTEIIQETVTMGGGEYLKTQMRDAGDTRDEVQPLTWDEWTDAIADIAIKTMQGTAIIGGMGPSASYLNDISRAYHARGNAAFYNALGEAAEESETRKHIPNKFKEYLQAQQEKGKVKELRIQIEAWNEYWESQDLNPAEVAKGLGINLEEMEAQGADVVIGLETWAEKMAHTEHHKALFRDMRLRPDEMTYNEAKNFLDNPEEHIEALRQELGEEFGEEASGDFDLIVEDVTGQLIGQMNYDRSAAEQQARVVATVMTTQALRNPQADITPWALYLQRFGGIRLDTLDPAQPRKAFDPTVDPLLDRIRAGDFPSTRSIYGESLADFVVKRGGLIDDGGELSARDYRKLKRGLVRTGGETLDGMAEAAYEAGYIPERDPQLLLDMLDRELQQDQPVYSNVNVDENLQGLNEDLERMADYLDVEGIDLTELSNQQVRERMAARTMFEQIDTDELNALTDYLLGEVLRAEEAALLGDPYETESPVNTILSKAAAMLPRVGEQDFGDMEIADRVSLKGRPGTRTRKAQQVYEQKVKKRNALKTLMDCLGGSK